MASNRARLVGRSDDCVCVEGTLDDEVVIWIRREWSAPIGHRKELDAAEKRRKGCERALSLGCREAVGEYLLVLESERRRHAREKATSYPVSDHSSRCADLGEALEGSLLGSQPIRPGRAPQASGPYHFVGSSQGMAKPGMTAIVPAPVAPSVS